MSDPFQAKRQKIAPAATETVRGLRDTGRTAQGRDKYTAPRKPRVGRAIQLMDVLTSGDEALDRYLKENGPDILRRVEEARADMELAETPEEAELFRPDSMDELLVQMIQTVSVKEEAEDGAAELAPAEPLQTQTSNWDASDWDEPETEPNGSEPAVFDLSALKASLMDECQNAIVAASLPTPEELEPPVPKMYLSDCGIPGCSIHSIDPQRGDILHHFACCEVNTPALRTAELLIHGSRDLAYVEVYEGFVCAVTSGGKATKYPL